MWKMWQARQSMKRLRAPWGVFLALMMIWAAACCAPFQGALALELSTESMACHKPATTASTHAHPSSHSAPHQDCQCLHPHKQSPAFVSQDLLGSLQQLSQQWTFTPLGCCHQATMVQNRWTQIVRVPRPPPDSSVVWQALARPPVFYSSTVLLI